jgi:hypothetical protein
MLKRSIIMHLSRFPLIAALAMASVSSVASVSSAADTSFRTELDASSRRNGVGRASLPVLMRVPGQGRDVVSAKLVQRLATSKSLAVKVVSARGRAERDMLENASDKWSLRVFADGTKAKFRDMTYLNDHPELIRRVADRMPQADAEARARSFIKSELSEFVKLGPGEALVALKTVYETRQEGDVRKSAPEPAQAVASTAVFGRTVNGVAIIGAGSKVAVTFANDGTVVAFDFDWPELAGAGEEQEVLPLSGINERASALSSLRMKSATVKIKHFECGYADLGARRGSGVLQAACQVQYVGTKLAAAGQSVSAGQADLVPAGVNVLADRGWPEAQALCVGGDSCKGSDLTPALPPPAGN